MLTERRSLCVWIQGNLLWQEVVRLRETGPLVMIWCESLEKDACIYTSQPPDSSSLRFSCRHRKCRQWKFFPHPFFKWALGEISDYNKLCCRGGGLIMHTGWKRLCFFRQAREQPSAEIRFLKNVIPSLPKRDERKVSPFSIRLPSLSLHCCI